jgi:hypothetical protein
MADLRADAESDLLQLLFLSTFVLSALGMFLPRANHGQLRRGVVPASPTRRTHRVTSIPHLQVLSSAWMPFALMVQTVLVRRSSPDGERRRTYLAGASLAWIAQNPSCGYHPLFFSPIGPADLEMSTWDSGESGAWSSRCSWRLRWPPPSRSW